ncbi:CBS domain-containing protein [Roseivivax lentus]|uniref:CBS domain-containing protein n=2 Tax=Roseivivax lentus TaxID=633194 RepID=A0A1N7LP94_9RHOB|nr:CBS domain-containing protein [Roseivivax lentus]
MTRDPVCISPDMTLARVIDGVILGRGCGVLPVVEDGVLLGRLDRRMVAAIDREHWASTRANDVFVETRADHVLSAPMRLAEVFTLITETGQHKFLVTQEEGRLVGVVTLSDLTEYLSPP